MAIAGIRQIGPVLREAARLWRIFPTAFAQYLEQAERIDDLVKVHGRGRVAFARELAERTEHSTEHLLTLSDDALREVARKAYSDLTVELTRDTEGRVSGMVIRSQSL